MSAEDAARLAEYALGLLSTEETRALSRELEGSERLRAELDETIEALQWLARDTRPIEPPADLGARILAAAGPGPDRYEGFARRLGGLFDLSVERMREHLRRISEPPPGPSWRKSGVSGVWLYDFEGGPAAAGADCGFVFLEPGAEFPHHGHGGLEEAIVIGGEAHTDDGDVWLPGTQRAAGTDDRHAFRAVGASPFVFGVKLEAPIRPTRD
ncbi:MAG: hypothetical protein QNK05_15560 [Myxococcota bacterium]|nr:hypothetical protein [Myxococcota bacterium]